MASDDRENLEALLEKGLTDAKISPSTRFIKQTVDFIHELAKALHMTRSNSPTWSSTLDWMTSTLVSLSVIFT